MGEYYDECLHLSSDVEISRDTINEIQTLIREYPKRLDSIIEEIRRESEGYYASLDYSSKEFLEANGVTVDF